VIGVLSIGVFLVSNRLCLPHEYLIIVRWHIEYLSLPFLDFVYNDGDTLSCADKTEFGPLAGIRVEICSRISSFLYAKRMKSQSL
jgi:hypothetical protein